MMIFRRKGPRVEHPVFGPLERDRFGDWCGEIEFGPVGAPVLIRVPGSPSTPADWAVQALEALTTRFPELEPRVLDALLACYVEESRAPEAPAPATAAEMGALLTLDDIAFESPDVLRLGYGFRTGVGWDDAIFTVELSGWRIRAAWLDD